jgi:hypothetical protein
MLLSLASSENLFAEPESRERYLRRVFSRVAEFSYRNRRTVFEPDREQDGLLLGWFTRPTTESIRDPPEQGYAVKSVENWKLARVAVDPEGDPQGQKAAVDHVCEAGLPLALMRAFAESLNDADPPPRG